VDVVASIDIIDILFRCGVRESDNEAILFSHPVPKVFAFDVT